MLPPKVKLASQLIRNLLRATTAVAVVAIAVGICLGAISVSHTISAALAVRP